MAIQETQMVDLNKIKVSNIWDNSPFDYIIQNACGRSGGLLCLWDPNIFTLQDSKHSRYYIWVKGVIKGVERDVFVVNVYAPQDSNLKKALWDELSTLMEENDGLWITLGDFNCVRNPNKRKNSVFCLSSASDFNNFINRADLYEYNIGGYKFTYLSDVGNKCSKIDRILVGQEFINYWPLATLTALPKKYSDHRPLVLSCVDLNFGPKPFRFFNSWLLNKDLEKVVTVANNIPVTDERPDVRLANKLRRCKIAIKAWRKEMVYKEHGMRKELYNRLNTLDICTEISTLTEQEDEERIVCKKRIEELEKSKLLDLKQNAGIKWVIEGDENSAYFHDIINCHKKTIEFMVCGLIKFGCQSRSL
ncbi:uncharacterized protein LOC143533846 [Bidens hawaiensis]|uniref:uncharacterized protein LOC143533846 n=1 Tax=Bidens hawaiensis TaxID=980011 RepID=UPI00404B9D99